METRNKIKFLIAIMQATRINDVHWYIATRLEGGRGCRLCEWANGTAVGVN